MIRLSVDLSAASTGEERNIKVDTWGGGGKIKSYLVTSGHHALPCIKTDLPKRRIEMLGD